MLAKGRERAERGQIIGYFYAMQIPEILPGSKAILGFSGGVDSVVLSHYLVERYRIRPYLLHVNYGLREEADDDERWCRWYAEEHRFKIIVLRADPSKRKGQNVQNWARDIRYDFFLGQAKNLDARYIFTAHHADDRRESFLMNALRGAGLTSITGLNDSRFIRPLAHMNKDEVIAYAEAKGLEWVEDASNATLKYKRNKIRHQLNPVLDAVEPRWRGGLKKTIDNLYRDGQLLKGLLKDWSNRQVEVKDGEYYIKENSWAREKYAQVLLWRYLLHIDPGFSFEEVGHVLVGEIGQRTLGRTHLLIKDRGQFIVAPNLPLDQQHYTIVDVKNTDHLPFSLEFELTPKEEIIFGPEKEWISIKIPLPLTIRRWKPGDKFSPLGMNGQKKVADFLNDLRIPRHHKERVYIAEYEGKVLWVIGYRIDDSLKVADSDEMAYLARINPKL